MTARDLIDAFETIADAPNGVEKLRELVLQLAVRGQLIPQDFNDEPASELLDRITKEEALLFREGQIRKPKKLPPITHDEIPFDAPQGWEWCRLGRTLIYTNGFAFKSAEYQEDGIGIIRMSNLQNGAVTTANMKYVPRRYYDELSEDMRVVPGDLVIGMSGSIGQPAFNFTDQVYLLNQRVGKITPILVSKSYLAMFMQTVEQHYLQISYGSGIKNLSTKQILETPFPLPPLAEQHRIVAKVDELMSLLDRLEAARGSRDTTRASLRDAALQALQDAEDAEEVQAAWSRISENMDELFTDPADVEPLRKTVIKLAVRGCLVAQEQADEPATVLLDLIKDEKAQLVKKRLMRRPKANSKGRPALYPYELPAGWSVVYFMDVARWAVGSGFPKKYQGHTEMPYLFCKVSDMNLAGNEKEIHQTVNYIDQKICDQIRANIHPPGTVVFPKIGGAIATNKRRILVSETAIDNNCLGLIPYSQVNPEWLYYLLLSIDLSEYQSGTSVPALSQGVLETIPLGLPPVGEQQRIVDRVDELMVLIDDLGSQLAVAASLQSAFAHATVSDLAS